MLSVYIIYFIRIIMDLNSLNKLVSNPASSVPPSVSRDNANYPENTLLPRQKKPYIPEDPEKILKKQSKYWAVFDVDTETEINQYSIEYAKALFKKKVEPLFESKRDNLSGLIIDSFKSYVDPIDPDQKKKHIYFLFRQINIKILNILNNKKTQYIRKILLKLFIIFKNTNMMNLQKLQRRYMNRYLNVFSIHYFRKIQVPKVPIKHPSIMEEAHPTNKNMNDHFH